MHRVEKKVGQYLIRVQSSLDGNGWVWQVHKPTPGKRGNGQCLTQAWDSEPSEAQAFKAANESLQRVIAVGKG